MPLTLLTDNDRKEQLSRAYVAAIAAHSGFTVSIPVPDRDSIDIQVSSGTSRRASVQFQLKATSSPDWIGNDLRFQLKQKNFNELALERQVPLLLAVMVLPSAEADWLSVSPDKLVLKRCVWWHSLIREPQTNQGSKQVVISGASVLDQSALIDLIDRSEKGTL